MYLCIKRTNGDDKEKIKKKPCLSLYLCTGLVVAAAVYICIRAVKRLFFREGNYNVYDGKHAGGCSARPPEGRKGVAPLSRPRQRPLEALRSPRFFLSSSGGFVGPVRQRLLAD